MQTLQLVSLSSLTLTLMSQQQDRDEHIQLERKTHTVFSLLLLLILPPIQAGLPAWSFPSNLAIERIKAELVTQLFDDRANRVN